MENHYILETSNQAKERELAKKLRDSAQGGAMKNEGTYFDLLINVVTFFFSFLPFRIVSSESDVKCLINVTRDSDMI